MSQGEWIQRHDLVKMLEMPPLYIYTFCSTGSIRFLESHSSEGKYSQL